MAKHEACADALDALQVKHSVSGHVHKASHYLKLSPAEAMNMNRATARFRGLPDL